MIAAKQRIAEAFGRASDYDSFASVQRRSAESLAARIASLPLRTEARVLEFGCGTGFLAAAAAPHLAFADWLMTDIAPDMVERSRRRFGGKPGFQFATLDAEAPSELGEQSFDLVCSNLTAQWFENLPDAVERLFRLVAPGGFLTFSTLAQGSFADWEAAHRALGLAAGLRPLPTPDMLASLAPLGSPASIELETHREAHDDALGFLRGLRAIGAATPRIGHRPLGPTAMRAVMRRFEAQGAEVRWIVAMVRFRRPL